MSLTIPYHSGVWTVDDLDALPETQFHVEIQDGNLLVSPSPGRPHVWVARKLTDVLAPQLGPALFIGFEHEIALTRTSVRRPDLFVVRTEQFRAGHGRLTPDEVVVAIEVVSPSSTTTDRLLKPVEYASAGIPGFWRVELEPETTLTAYGLGTDGYDELGTWGPGEVAHVTAPVNVTIHMDELTS